MATSDSPRQYVPLTCHGHSRPVPHLSFSPLEKDDIFMISACKDGNPMLRDGQTGDWIGTFIGHKGAVWQAKLSPDAQTAATASADFTARIWDTHTGELLYTLQHDHICRAVAYPYDKSHSVATGGFEKKLRVWDLNEVKPQLASPSSYSNANGTTNGASTNGNSGANGTSAGTAAAVTPVTIQANRAFEIGVGVHTEPIKFIVWAKNPNILVTAAGATLRWFDLPTRSCIKQEILDGEIKSCELVALAPEYSSPTDIGGGLPVLAVAAAKTVAFWGGVDAMDEIKRTKLSHNIASVALDLKGKKLVVGEEPGTWARVYRWDDATEIGKFISRRPLFGVGSRLIHWFRCSQGTPRPDLVHRLLS